MTTTMENRATESTTTAAEDLATVTAAALKGAGFASAVGSGVTPPVLSMSIDPSRVREAIEAVTKLQHLRVIQYSAPSATTIRLLTVSAGAEHAFLVIEISTPTASNAIRSAMSRTKSDLAGIMIVFLGPDGVGKSTLVRNLKTDLTPIVFGGAESFHLRPYVAGANNINAGVRNPHGKEPRGQFTSFLKLGLWWWDYTAGYLKIVRPLLKRNNLVLFDRYCHDLIVDQRRYRYGGPMALAHFVTNRIPQPDLFIGLQAPAEIVQTRKQDITLEETRRQLKAYGDMIAAMSRELGQTVNAEQPAADVAAAVERIILEHLHRRAIQRLNRDFGI